ncbi:MAG: ABC transporter permease [bacterium]|nr:ABC transporter permease [bacterium]
MFPWLARRLLSSLLMIVLLMTMVFAVVRLAPGDPLEAGVVETVESRDRELLRQRLGLDEPLADQYLRWVAGSLRGDWGTSLRQQRPVVDIVREAAGPTLLLSLTAWLLHLVLAVAAAVVMAARRGSTLDHLVGGVGLVLLSLPGFWLGLMLTLLFARQLGWLPAGGMHGADAALLPAGARLLDLLRHLVLPTLTLALGSFMATARYTRAALDEALGQDFILAARARGIGERRLLWRHALPHALLPLVTLAGLQLPQLLGGAVVIEVVFGWPGLGRVAVEAIGARDYPVVMAVTLLSAVLVTAGSLLADLGYRRADPRVGLSDGVTP